MPYKNREDHNAACLRRYHAKKEPHAAKMKEWYRENRKARMLSAARDRVKDTDVPFNLTVDDFEIPTHCPVFPWLELKIGDGKAGPQSPSLDRIICELGYVKGNVQVISNKANRMKSNGSIEELIALGEWAKNVSDLRP